MYNVNIWAQNNLKTSIPSSREVQLISQNL